jgi:XTP/dITP diphosphohydrolase
MSVQSRRPSLLLGTRNLGKVREIQTILGDVPWRFRSLREFAGVEIPNETGDTYAANAIIKAQFYARATGICALADDSGLEVEALGGAPGVLSARYAGAGASDADRRRLLLSDLAQVPAEKRRARFVCAVAVATPAATVMNIAEGTCEGTIIFEPRGSGGFGYDPLFVPDGFTKTFAELSDIVKNELSHRARALLKTREFLLSNA